MKNLFTPLAVLLFFIATAQNVTKTYTPSTAVISNPERGFYKFTSAKSSSYEGLNQTTITNYRLNQNITLIYREFRLENFINTPISAIFLSNMQSDFDKIRNAGLKCIVRFTYSNSETATQRDASKATILSHLEQLKPILAKNVDVVSLMQAGFIGAWGEWYYTSQAEFGGQGYYDGKSLTTANIDNRREVVNAMLDALPTSRMIQLRKPSFKQNLLSTSAITDNQAYNESNTARTGHFNDCFLASSSDYGTYDNATKEYPYLEQDTKFVPMGGETCKVNSPRSDCATAVSEMSKFHWSFLNYDYHLGVIDGFVQSDCFEDIQKDLGYRFQLNTGTFPNAVELGKTLDINIKISNLGYAAPFNKRNAYLVLKNLTTNQVYPILLNSDPRLWVGTNEITLSEQLTLPENLTTGNYKLYLSLPDDSPSIASKPEFAIRFANEGVWESTTGYNNLNHTLNVTNASSLGIADYSKLNMSIYPVPANNEITIELDGINEYKVTFYNSLGQTVKSSTTSEMNKMVINTESLSNGLYFIEFAKGTVKDTRKVIIKH